MCIHCALVRLEGCECFPLNPYCGLNRRWVTGTVGLLVTGLTIAYVRPALGFGFWFGLAFGSALVEATRESQRQQDPLIHGR